MSENVDHQNVTLLNFCFEYVVNPVAEAMSDRKAESAETPPKEFKTTISEMSFGDSKASETTETVSKAPALSRGRKRSMSNSGGGLLKKIRTRSPQKSSTLSRKSRNHSGIGSLDRERNISNDNKEVKLVPSDNSKEEKFVPTGLQQVSSIQEPGSFNSSILSKVLSTNSGTKSRDLQENFTLGSVHLYESPCRKSVVEDDSNLHDSNNNNVNNNEREEASNLSCVSNLPTVDTSSANSAAKSAGSNVCKTFKYVSGQTFKCDSDGTFKCDNEDVQTLKCDSDGTFKCDNDDVKIVSGKKRSAVSCSKKVYGLRPRLHAKRLWSAPKSSKHDNASDSVLAATTETAEDDDDEALALSDRTEESGGEVTSASETAGNNKEGPFRSKQKRASRSKPLSKYKRITANARERERMREINTAFAALREALPKISNYRIASMTKHTTLQLAVSYIKDLSKLLDETSPDADTENPKENYPAFCNSLLPANSMRDVNLSVEISETPYDRASQAGDMEAMCPINIKMDNQQIDELVDFDSISDWTLDFALE